MARPVKWSRDVHCIRDKALRSSTETWSRQDIEHLFDIARASSQTLMKAIGGIQTVGGTHFVDRISLLGFLDEMIASASIEEALRTRMLKAEPPPRPKPLRVTLPAELRNAMLPDLPSNITIEPGRLEIRVTTAISMLESLVTLATIMGNDLHRFQQAVEVRNPVQDEELQTMLAGMRNRAAAAL